MGLEPNLILKQGMRTARCHASPEDAQKKRHASAPTDTCRCPNQSTLSSSPSAPQDTVNLASLEQIVLALQPKTIAVGESTSCVPVSPWLTIRQGERYAHVGDGILRAAIKRGDVPAYKREGGKGVLVNVNDLDAWIRSWNLAKGAFA